MFNSKRKYYEAKTERSKAMTALAIIGAIASVVAGAFIIYKVVKAKTKVSPKNPRMLGRIDMDGDGVLDAIMLDTTGDGEVDTIIIDKE